MISAQVIALKTLLAISAFLGVSDIPKETNSSWSIEKRWEPDSTGAYTFEATNQELVAYCQGHPSEYVIFPNIVHGTHEAFLNERRVMSFGDPTFQTVRSFYGSPVLACADLKHGGTLRWRARCYTRYFARFGAFPLIRSKHPLVNVISENLYLFAGGAILILALFALIIFWGKVRRRLTLAVAISSLGYATYLLSCVAGHLGLEVPMIYAHKAADLGLWIASACLFYGFQLHQVIDKTSYRIYLAHIIAACVFIAFGTTGDIIQFGTCLPFGCTFYAIGVGAYRTLHLSVFKGRLRRRSLYDLVALSVFFFVAIHDILVITGVSMDYLVLPLGLVGAQIFFTLAVNDQINQTYEERDFLRLNLEKEVERKTEELRKALVDLKSAQADLIQSEKLASLGTLSAGIAHEINNSLNFVYGSLKPLERIVETEIQPEKKSKASSLIKVMSEGLRLTFEIIKSLQSYTGLNQSKFNDLSIRDVVGSVLTLVKNRIGSKIQVVCEIPESIKLFGNVIGLNQILMNLVINALDAMPDGGKLTVHAAEEGGEVRLKISDTGSGIPTEIREKIFEPFFTTKGVGKGSGLGLYIVQMEVSRHKGKLKIDSEPGKGTTFEIALPKQGPGNEVAA